METNEILKQAKEYCDKNDKSTEFMLQYMQDVSNISLDEVIDYLINNK